MEKIEVKWISVLDELPPKGVDVYVLRLWLPRAGKNPGKSHQECVVAKRNSECELTLNSDTSRNSWWHTDRSSFSDSTVHSWAYIPKPKDILIPVVSEIIYSSDEGIEVFIPSSQVEIVDKSCSHSIASEPELLSALKRIAEYPETSQQELGIEAIKAIARVAIERVEGDDK